MPVSVRVSHSSTYNGMSSTHSEQSSTYNGEKTMKVKQLIAELKKMPPDAIVVWQDHDQSEEEYNAKVFTVTDITGGHVSEEFNCPVVAIHG